jgi:hypothetical protein
MEFQNIREALTGRPLGVPLLGSVLFIAWVGTTFVGLLTLMFVLIKRSRELSFQQGSVGIHQGISKDLFFVGGVLLAALGIIAYQEITTRLLMLLSTLYGAGKIMNRYS